MKEAKRTASKSVKPFSGDITVGIDTHKKDYHVCVWSVDQDCKIQRWVQPPDVRVLIEKLKQWRAQIVQIVYEAGPVGFELARQLIQDGWPAIVTSPGDVPTGRYEAKSDRADAQRLALLSARKLLQPIHIPTAEHDRERQLQRQRQQFMKDRKRSQLRIRMFMLYSNIAMPEDFTWTQSKVDRLSTLITSEDLREILQYYIEAYYHAQSMVNKTDQRLKKLAQREHNQETIQHLCTIPGIGQRTALEFLLEMGPASRFETKHQVAKYQGLAPDVRSSGQSRKEGPLNRSGNRRLKTLLIEAAWRWRHYDPHAKTHYARMLSNTGCAQKAITAVAHKLGIIMWNILKNQTDYIPGGTGKKVPHKTPKQTTGKQTKNQNPQQPGSPA